MIEIPCSTLPKLANATKRFFLVFDLDDVLSIENFRLNNPWVVDRMRPTFASYSLISLIGNVVSNLLGLNGINESAPNLRIC